MNQKYPKSRKQKLRVKLKTFQVQLAYFSDWYMTVMPLWNPIFNFSWNYCDEKPIAHLAQPREHMICTNCVKKINYQLCEGRIANNITIDFDDFEWHFHVFQCLNLNGAPADFSNVFHFVNFCKILTFLCFMHLNEFIDFDKFQQVVHFGPSFCFSWKVRCPIVEHLIH